MKNKIEDMEGILNYAISGFHQYVLNEPFHLVFASQNLCDMIGFPETEFVSKNEDLYAKLIHPDDQKKYSEFLYNLSKTEQKQSLEYRIYKNDGSFCYVSDTMVSKRLENGAIAGYSVLKDISEINYENNNLQFLNDTIHCGFIKYTCESRPKVTYVNDTMLKMLHFPDNKDGEPDYLKFYKEDIYLMIPMEERRRLSLFLNRVDSLGSPIAGEMSVLRYDGTKCYLFGWATKVINEQGEEEFQSVCMDITDRYHIRKNRENMRYIKALSDVYDKIFELDFTNNTICCISGKKSAMFKWLEDIPMQITEAVEKWIDNTVHVDDIDNVREFFKEYSRKRLDETETKPPQISYRAMSSSGTMKNYAGILLKIDNSISLYCCRNVTEADEITSLKYETQTLKNINENMQQLVSQFTEGIAAFELVGNCVKPLYASENIREFFDYTKEEWMSLMKEGTPLEKFVSRSGSSLESYMNLLKKGEAEFLYYDLTTNSERRIKAICSQRSADGNTPRYVMLYNMDVKRTSENLGEQINVSIRTFGYFDVFIGKKPIAFRTQKAKELFALLVDRKGGFISSDEAIGFLWEDEPVNTVTLARYRKIALRLKNILEEYGIADIVETVDGKRRLVTEKVQCDLYDYLSGKEEFSQLFKGSYLTNYSWAETTLGELTNNQD